MSASESTATIPSIQLASPGAPRFHVPPIADDADWELAVGIEAEGGVEAEFRAFLDSQLETGDVVLDLSPGFGFVALSATTAPGGMPTVLVAGLPVDRMQQLQDAAAEAGGWIEGIGAGQLERLAATVEARLEPDGQVFVHTACQHVAWVCEVLRDLISAGRVLAISICDPFDKGNWPIAQQALATAELTPCTMLEQQGDAVLLPCAGDPTAAVIALPSSLAASVSTTATSAENTVVAPDRLATIDDVFVAAIATPAADEPSAASRAESRPLVANERWSATRDGFSFVAPHARTGYGVAASQLLRALQVQGVPVAFFPIGPLDRGLIDNPQLGQGLRLQGAFRPDVPSVRMAQQFDLALHVGRGRHVAYTVFERDRFTVNEQHHLQQQDALLVCSEWARNVCAENGVADRPIHVVPHGVDREVFHEAVLPSTEWSETVFMQVGKLEPRKGQLELLRAFEDAFTPRDAVRLVLSCGNPFLSRADLDKQLFPFHASPMASRVTLLTNELPSLGDVAALMAAADCGVFPSRAEGWNLGALEMLSMGKTVIATNCTAHTEYLNRDNAMLIGIDHFEQATANGFELPGRWAAWGASQHDQLVAQMREVHARKQRGSLGRNDSGIRTAQRYSWSHAASAVLRALDAIV